MEDDIDLWNRNNDGRQICSQSKARNGSKDYWTIGDLGAKGVFENVKQQLGSSKEIAYQFVTAVNCMMINSLRKVSR
ncbi:hypothetical protein KW850_29570 [Bacillus sp. sid0103]|uniref:hypothetical protein n=1 Tax=Bacillus sp. sid0103 TaxID=2856337 RepID=UPI001C493768|nr:hypothetical protein [Bacillus sp. sid0103]MBV7509327.1 hypothetical protein [Bacillus sp. sid0103]